jgi:hypothetical protein
VFSLATSLTIRLFVLAALAKKAAKKQTKTSNEANKEMYMPLKIKQVFYLT